MFHRRSLLLFFGFGCCWCLGCSGPPVVWISPGQHQDIGLVKAVEDPVLIDFQIHNGTDTPVKIIGIYPSCTCTEVKLEQNPVAANSTVRLRASVSPTKVAGKQDFQATILEASQ